MSKESTYGIGREPIFRETFNSEAEVRKNGGTFTGSYSFVNGLFKTQYSIPGYITYTPKRITPSFSVRLKIKFDVINPTMVLFEGKRDTSYFDVYLNVSSQLAASSATKIYVDGVNYIPAGFVPVAGVLYDIIITTTSSISKFTVCSNLTGSFTPSSSLELLEIYQGLLTQEEVTNLYNNKHKYEPVLDKDEQLGPELIDQTAWYTPGYWNTFSAEWSQSGNTLVNTGATGGSNLVKNNFYTIGKRYKIKATCSQWTSGVFFMFYDGNVTTDVQLNAVSTKEGYFIPTATTMRLTSFSANGAISALSVKEVLVNRTRTILDVSQGVNRLSGNVYNELITNGGFDTDTNWSKASGWTISNGVAVASSATGSIVSIGALLSPSYPRTYRVRYTIVSLTAGSILANPGGFTNGTARSTTGTFTEDIIVTNASSNTNFYLEGAGFTGTIDNVSVKEVIPSVVNTAVDVVKEGDVIGMRFNGTSSKIDCGSYDSLVGDKTLIFWIDQRRRGYETALNPLISNGKLRLNWQDSGANFFLYRDGAAYAYSNQIPMGNSRSRSVCIVIASDSTGVTAFYLNGVSMNVPDSSAGIPTAGTANILIGSDPIYFLKGIIHNVKIIDGLLTPTEIAQLYSSEKHKYGL